MKRRTLLASLSALPALAAAQTPRPAPAARGALLLSGATLMPVDRAPLPRGQLLLLGERILAVLAEGEALPALPPGTDLQRVQLDATQRLYPGLVAVNTQLGLVENPSSRATLDAQEIGPLNPNVQALTAFNADSELVAVARAGGVLTAEVAPLSERGGLLAGVSGVVHLDGWAWTDMALRRRHALHLYLPPSSGESSLFVESAAPPASAVQLRLRQLDEALDQARAYAAARQADPQRPRDLRLEALAPYVGAAGPVVVHTPEPVQVRQALALQQRHGLRMLLVGRGALLPFADLLRERGLGLVVNGVQELPARRDDPIDAVGRLPAQLHAAGLRFALAREAGLSNAHNLRNLPHEAGAAVAHGLDAAEALRAITLTPAEQLGVGAELGSLTPGKLGSVILCSQDVMEPANRVLRAWVRGREIALGSRQTRLVDKYADR